ncbi:MAG TPA: UDP-N-acetylmuramoyl-tripeptide--D-alanyl-D-alanine ligase [Armatimonadota bacterium]|jgi:UDP-N-acetylmuramoyl-tripeptide--D-alanyl-D-alanine ligase
MPLFTLEEVIAATSGQLLLRGPFSQFSAVSTDTRALQMGDLFIAIRGERWNGHDFLSDALKAGAAGVIVEQAVPGVRRSREYPPSGDWAVIEVTDTLYALGKLAQYHRERFHIPVVGITGSAGKTTTKEMTAAILEQGRNILKSQGNFNNEIGLPLTLLKLTAEHQAAVLEFGMRGRGQIGYLAALSHPTIGVITNIGLTHLELLGSQEEIALAKAELLDELTPRSTAVLPAGDAFFPLLREHAPGPVVTFGEESTADFSSADIHLAEDGCAHFLLRGLGRETPVTLGTPGRHQVWNALAAAAAALTAGATLDDVQAGLAGYRAVQGRMQTHAAPRGFRVVDDTYNANPTALRATLHFLAEVPGGRKIAILGDMRELGVEALRQHREIGRYAMELGLDALLAVGDLGKEYVAGADDPRAAWFPDNAAAAHAALEMLTPGDVVLVKGSRAMHMEDIVAALLTENGG